MVMHAAALDHELDGEIERAFELLRAAIKLVPDDPMIAFDLARLALEQGSNQFDDDVESFMGIEPKNDDARVLRAHVLVRQGERLAAREQLDAMMVHSPDLGEATRLRDFLVQAGTQTPTHWYAANLQVGVETDTNVTVAPDALAGEEGVGVRLATQGGLTLVPVRGDTELTVNGVFKYAPHLNNREDFATFDVASAAALARLRRVLGPVILTAQVSGNEVTIDSFQTQFMRDLFGDFELRYPTNSVQLAVFGRGGYRDFASISDGAFNPEGDRDDRDGTRYSAGGSLDWQRGQLGVSSQISFEGASTDGKNQDEYGLELGVHLRWRPLPWQARLGVNYALRRFPESMSDGDSRMDNRFTASLHCSRVLHEHLAAFASVVWVKNLSNHEYDYNRLLMQLGVMAQW